MEHDCDFETLLKKLRQFNGELADLLAHLYAKAPGLICEILRGVRLGIQFISPDLKEAMSTEDQSTLLSLLRRVELVEQLLDELARDPDRDFASLITRHPDLARDRLFFPDMRRMTAEFKGGRAELSPKCRKLLKDALADHDLAQRMCGAENPEDRDDRNAAWQQFEERYHKLIYYRINGYPGTRELDQHEKQDVMQDVLMEMMRAACKYDARMAALDTFLTVVANRVCYRFGGERPSPDASPDDEDVSAELPALTGLEYQLTELLDLFQQTMAYRETDDTSCRIYRYLLELKWKKCSASESAEQINLALNPSPALNENSINQRWNELKGWLKEEDRREEIFEGAMSSHLIGSAERNVYRRILYLKLRGWLPHQIAESYNQDFAPEEPLTAKSVQQHWATLKRWMAEWLRRSDRGEDTK